MLSGEDFQNSVNRLIWWLLKATRGGPMRIRILKSIIDNPKNANQISKEIEVNYRTVEHHLKLLSDNNLIMAQGDGYGKVYFISNLLSGNLNILHKVIDETQKDGMAK